MEPNSIIVARHDYERLRQVIEESGNARTQDESTLCTLEAELDRATVVEPEEVPANVITMNSTVRVQARGRTKVRGPNAVQTWTLVYPEEADVEENRLSVLAPLGTALLGYRVGDTFEWDVPAGRRRYKIMRIIHQPEAAGTVQRS